MMKRAIWIAALFLLVAGLTAGVHFATESESSSPSEQPAEEQAPLEPEVLGICSQTIPACNSSSCAGPNCIETCPLEEIDTGWTRCCNKGNELRCSGGDTVHTKTCECGGGFCSQGASVKYFCA